VKHASSFYGYSITQSRLIQKGFLNELDSYKARAPTNLPSGTHG